MSKLPSEAHLAWMAFLFTASWCTFNERDKVVLLRKQIIRELESIKQKAKSSDFYFYMVYIIRIID